MVPLHPICWASERESGRNSAPVNQKGRGDWSGAQQPLCPQCHGAALLPSCWPAACAAAGARWKRGIKSSCKSGFLIAGLWSMWVVSCPPPSSTRCQKGSSLGETRAWTPVVLHLLCEHSQPPYASATKQPSKSKGILGFQSICKMLFLGTRRAIPQVHIPALAWWMKVSGASSPLPVGVLTEKPL